MGTLLKLLQDVWPPRLTLCGRNLGDVWRHHLLADSEITAELIPFHKLSQWLTYSLLEPLEEAGFQVQDIDSLTGLPEYRNGGLFVDTGVLQPRNSDTFHKPFHPGDEVIVEWRALTVCLLDRVADMVRTKLGKSLEEFPVAKVLEGGTWAAGRRIAKQKRPDGGPPISIISDGSVF